jgi:hypothetical protein
MSSNYRAICTSHTPALVIDHDYTYDEANNLTTRDSLGDHTDCDVVIGRYSYPLVEAACLGRQLPGPSGCKGYHAGPHWVDVAWLRLLTAATTAPNTVDPALLRRISAHGCWTPERMTSLRGELGMPDPPPTPVVCPRCKGHGKVPDWTNFDQYHGEPKPKPCPDCTSKEPS